MPPEGPEQRRQADDQEIEGAQQTGLAAMAVLVPGHFLVNGRPAVDEVPQGDAAVHVGCAHHMDLIRNAGKVAIAAFSLQEPAENETGQVLRQLPHLQEDGGQDGQDAPHNTRTR